MNKPDSPVEQQYRDQNGFIKRRPVLVVRRRKNAKPTVQKAAKLTEAEQLFRSA